MTKFLFFSFLLVYATTDSFAQKANLQKDKEAVDTLFFSNQKLALEISEKNIPTALIANDTVMITYFLDQAGEINRKEGKYDEAVEQLQQCLIYKKNWKDLKDLSLTHNNLGKTYTNKGQYELAVYHFLEALKLMEKDNNLMGQGFYLNNLAAVYDLQHNYTKALEYYNQSLEIKKQSQDSTGIAASYVNLAITYSNLSDLNKALEYNEMALKIYMSLGSITKIIRVHNNLGEVYLKTEDKKQALFHFKEALSKELNNQDLHLKTSINNNMGKCYLSLNQLDSARYFNDRALKMALESKSFKSLKEVYALKSNIAESEGKYKYALELLNTANNYNDSLINEANIYAVVEMESKYEHEKNLREISDGKLAVVQKEQMIEEQKVKVFFWISISIFLIITAIVLIVLYFLKQKNSQLLKGQLALINARNNALKDLNKNINSELDRTQITLEQKEELLNNVFSAPKNKDLPSEILALSKREMEVLSHLALGWSDEQLAEKLFVSKSTVKTHLRRIYAKLLVRGRAEAVNIAHKYDLIGNNVG